MVCLGFKTPRHVAAIAAESFIFVYPLILMELTRQQLTATSVAGELLAPMNQFAHMREPPLTPVTPVVNPNRDALYSSAWVDLSAGPVVLSLPEIVDRYFTMPMYDAWTRVFAAPSTRTGTATRSFLILGPNSPATVPPGPSVIHAPTNLVWLIGRIEVAGPEDYPTVHALQQRLGLALQEDPPCRTTSPTLPHHDLRFVPPAASRLERLDARTSVNTAAALLTANPPRPEDAAAVKRLGQVRLLTEPSSQGTPRDERTAKNVARGMADGLAQIEAEGRKTQGVVRGGWVFLLHDPVREPQDYLQRAAVAWTGLGATPLDDALTCTTRLDAEGHPLSGEYCYRLHFAPGATPPARASWSLAVRDARPFFVNEFGPDVVGSRNPLQYNEDGSLDIHLQQREHPPCSARCRNWLRTPGGAFGLVLRLYWPHPDALRGTWLPPSARRLCRVARQPS
jgi:hypothetical protein